LAFILINIPLTSRLGERQFLFIGELRRTKKSREHPLKMNKTDELARAEDNSKIGKDGDLIDPF